MKGAKIYKKAKRLHLTKEQIDKKVEYSTMIFFQMLQLNHTVRELKDFTTQDEKQELNLFLNMTKRVISKLEKVYKVDTEDSDEELNDAFYYMQEVTSEMTERLMFSFLNGTEAQFLDSTKFFKKTV